MQFYGQDVAAGVHNEAIGSTSPLDFSRDPDGPDASAYNFPVASNFFSYYMLGNVGFISYSGWCINNNKQAQLCINPCIRMTTSCPLHYVLSQCPMLIRLDFITSHHITSSSPACHTCPAHIDAYRRPLLCGDAALLRRGVYLPGHTGARCRAVAGSLEHTGTGVPLRDECTRGNLRSEHHALSVRNCRAV